jgi:hypothetical protein
MPAVSRQYYSICVGRDRSVGIATRCGLDGPGMESWWGAGFSAPRQDRSWGPPSLLYDAYRLSFPGIKRPGRGFNHPPPSSVEVKERVELYLYSASEPLWLILGRSITRVSVAHAVSTRDDSAALVSEVI